MADSLLFEDRKRKEIAQMRIQAAGAGIGATSAVGYLDEATRLLDIAPSVDPDRGAQIDNLLGLARNVIFKAEKGG